MGEIKWTEKASTNLQAIFDYISRDSKIYAARYVKALIITTRKLETMPRCGRIVPELENPDLREVIYGNYRIVYRIVGVNEDIEFNELPNYLRTSLSCKNRYFYGCPPPQKIVLI